MSRPGAFAADIIMARQPLSSVGVRCRCSGVIAQWLSESMRCIESVSCDQDGPWNCYGIAACGPRELPQTNAMVLGVEAEARRRTL